MKPLVIYHANCTDGFGAAFAAWTVLGDNAEYLPMNHNEPLTADVVGREVYVLDFSFPRGEMERLFADSDRVVWLDHHKTAFEMWEVLPFCCDGEWWKEVQAERHILLDNNKSGALLAWEYFHPNVPAPALIRMIDDRDRWQFKLPDSKALHAGLRLYGFDFKAWARLVGVMEGKLMPGTTLTLERVIDTGNTVLRVYDEQIKSAAGKAEKCRIPVLFAHSLSSTPLPGLAVNSAIHQSEIGHELANASGTYGLIWYYDGATGRANCSLRSNGDYDVSAIAKTFGGGGHKNAAGFNIDMPTLLGWLRA